MKKKCPTLDHSPPRSLFVLQFRLTTNSDNPRIIRRAGDQSIERVSSDTSISVDDQHVLFRPTPSVDVRRLKKEIEPRRVEDQHQ